jgi:hypothetical protein
MTDSMEQWTPGVLPSDAKIGTDDPEEEAAQLEGQLPVVGKDDTDTDHRTGDG